MSFYYPLDPDVLRKHLDARKLGPRLDLDGSSRDDLVLTTLVWEVGHGWFPLDSGFAFHGAVDIGLPDDGASESFVGAPVRAVADGEVLYAEAYSFVQEGYAFGRAVIRHRTGAGETFYALYQHLEHVKVVTGSRVKAGAELGKVGWHGDFPHLHFAIASDTAIGGAEDLVPECDAGALPSGDDASNVLRVKVDGLEAAEWPGVPAGPKYLYNPIEFVRFNLGLPYEHDIGAGSPHGVLLKGGGSVSSLKKGEANVHLVPTILQSSVLRASATLETLAHDTRFEPLVKGHADKDVVETLQRALKAAGFNVGKDGPKHDGIDGRFDKTLEAVVKKFQAKAAKQTRADSPFPAPTVDGRIDWATLLTLDRYVLAHEKAKLSGGTTVGKQAKDGAAELPPQVKLEPDPGAHVFDGEKRVTSLAFQMKMYKALLRWELKKSGDEWVGVKYSGTQAPYNKVYEKHELMEWPDMSFLVEASMDPVVCFGEQTKVFRAFGIDWKATGNTNCCNSMMAAFFVALGGRTLSRRRPDGTVETMSLQHGHRGPIYDESGKPRTAVVGTKTLERTRDILTEFEQIVMFTTSQNRFNSLGEKGHDANVGATTNALVYLELGAPVKPFTNKADDRRELRVGDIANTKGHSFLIGDVRYGLWVDGDPDKGDKPDYVLDQSSFVRSEAGELHAVFTRDAKGRKKYASVESIDAVLLDEAGCDWIIANEQTFEARVQAFLAAETIEIDGETMALKKKEVVRWQVFSANCLHGGSTRTIHGRIYEGSGDADLSGWTYKEKRTKDNAWRLGISRPWCEGASTKFSWGRCYAHAG